jgi:xanthine/uracil permease
MRSEALQPNLLPVVLVVATVATVLVARLVLDPETVVLVRLPFRSQVVATLVVTQTVLTPVVVAVVVTLLGVALEPTAKRNFKRDNSK